MGTLYDENSPKAPIAGDSEAGRVVGMAAAISSRVMTGAYEANVLPSYFVPDQAKAAAAVQLASARDVAYFSNPPATKFADESQLKTITFAPVPGQEANVKYMQAGYNPYLTKDPKVRSGGYGNPPNTSAIQRTLAGSPAQPINSSEDAILSILLDF